MNWNDIFNTPMKISLLGVVFSWWALVLNFLLGVPFAITGWLTGIGLCLTFVALIGMFISWRRTRAQENQRRENR